MCFVACDHAHWSLLAIFTVVQRVRHACDQEDIESMELYDKSLGAVMDANKSNPSERELTWMGKTERRIT